jgi:hypothetical protein
MGMCGKQQAQRDRKRQHPLAHRHPGDDVIARRAAVSTMRRAPQPGQKPRRLQLKATSFSWAQSAQRRRRKPRAKIGQEVLEVFLNQLIEDGVFGTHALVMVIAWPRVLMR